VGPITAIPAPVFISHFSAGRAIAERVVTALETRGIACWVSYRDSLPAENYQAAIVRAIRDASAVVLIFTGNANRSDEILRELALASQMRRMAVPLRVDNVEPADAFRFELATRQWLISDGSRLGQAAASNGIWH